jgi:hypothetical protein
MLTLTRGLLGGLLVLGLIALGTPSADVAAQAKKDEKKDPKAPPVVKKDDKKGKPEDLGDRSVSFGTSDGLALNGYFFQGTGIEKQRPDAVLMFPAPGTGPNNRVNDAWLDLARKLAEKNFSVLLFDWRGHGRNLEAGTRVFESPDLFWRESYNTKLLKSIKATIDDKGLDWKMIGGRGEGTVQYKDMLMNDLIAARFFLDRKSDEGRCNTNRVWIVSEKDGAHLGLAFVAAEFYRNTIYVPNPEPFKTVQMKSAGKDYCGLVALSYAPTNPTALRVYAAATPAAQPGSKDIRDHMQSRLANVLVYAKKEGSSRSKALVNALHGGATEAQMKTNFKYLIEVDTGTTPVTGIGMVDSMNTFKVPDQIQAAMVGISKVQNFGKDTTDRDAIKMSYVPRFYLENFARGR